VGADANRPPSEHSADALAAAGLGAFDWDPQRGVFTGSPELAALCGWERSALPCGLDALLARIDRADRARLGAALSAAFAGGTPLDCEVRLAVQPPALRWMRVRGGIRRDAAGDARSLAGVFEDVTARKLAEGEHAAALRRERELRELAERANRSKDEFLSVFSHELRSPLNAILGWNRILSMKRAADPEVLAMTARIERGARAQLKMVNDLLDLGRISTGKLRIEPRPVRLAAVLAATLDATRPAAAAKGVEILTRIDAPAAQVLGDADRLQQVIGNLLSNAVKFTDRAGLIEVSLHTHGPVVELEIADNGRGIPAELLPFVFDRFRQGDSSTTRRDSGLGLGLTLVREIVALHGGQVAVASDGTGRGARFTVRLPALDAAQSAAQDGHLALAAARARLAGLSILVVDDEADARAVVAETLRLEGAQVAMSDSAAGALARLHSPEASFDVIVTDIGMPIEDGYSLVRKVRQSAGGPRMIAIALTGYASQADREAAMEAGFDVHVAKPVDFDEFVPLIARIAHASGLPQPRHR